ncbi:hypothetical protein B0O99DRAFT_689374 [Bisporella sp. PMI_857]|nr:hypothetical protein B0O99DRAFT_689374 [Bisporella sp. PMI_857]
MGASPEVDEALPASSANQTRTARNMTPGVVLAALAFMGITAVVGIVVAGSVFSSKSVRNGVSNAAMGSLLMASLISIIYIAFHIRAADSNEPVGTVRPPVIRVHAMCFIVARVALLFWLITIVLSCIVVAKPSLCLVGSNTCKLQIGGLVAATFAFLSTGVILTALESSQFPFEVPRLFRFTRKEGTFAENVDAYERSVSQTSFYQDENGHPSEKNIEVKTQNRIRTEIAPPKPTLNLNNTSILREWPERPLTPLLPNPPKRMRSHGWGDEWTHSLRGNGGNKNCVEPSDSAISMSMSEFSSGSGRSSTGYARSSSAGYARSSMNSGYASNSDRESTSRPISHRPRTQRCITPSSSISDRSRRSPLSTMRSADCPEVAVRPTLRYTPPCIPPPHQWRLSRTASMSQLVSVADVHTLQRRASNVELPVRFRRTSKELPPIPGAQMSKSRRNTTGSSKRVPQAYVYSYHEQELEDHIRKIEASIARTHSQRQLARTAVARAGLERHPQPRVPLQPLPAVPATTDKLPLQWQFVSWRQDQGLEHPQKSVERMEMPQPQQIRESTVVRRSHTSAGETAAAHGFDATEFEDADAPEVSFVKVQPLRRLSLGDLPTGLDFGKSWVI